MVRRPHVALMIEASTVYGRLLLQGVNLYLRSHRPWSIFLEQREVDTTPPGWLQTWRGDGVISRWSAPRVASVLERLGLAVVDLSDRFPAFGRPRVNSDDPAIGRLAAEHLLERGLRSFACCGFAGQLWAVRRRQAFFEAVTMAGHTGVIYESAYREPGAHLREDERARIGRWLKSLPRPIGVLGTNDVRGIDVLGACQHVGLKVPEDVAILGVDNDVLLCEICNPPLSSVIPNIERIGYEAAALLDRLMDGGREDYSEWFIPPLGVAIRQSTDVLSVDDPELATALRFIREYACHGVTVTDVLDQISLSRSTMERRFRTYLGHSPQAEIHAVRLARAKQLLAETDHAIHRVAQLVGYEHPEYFNVVFKREVGRTPGEYRDETRNAKGRGMVTSPDLVPTGPRGN